MSIKGSGSCGSAKFSDFIAAGKTHSASIDEMLAFLSVFDSRVIRFDVDAHIDRAILLPSNTTVYVDNCTIWQNDDVFDNVFRSANVRDLPSDDYAKMIAAHDKTPWTGSYEKLPSEIPELENIRILGLGKARIVGPQTNAVINNAFAFMALLRGQDDFKEMMRLCVQCGWDVDCSCATAGALCLWSGVLEVMRRFAAANITMNCQIVLCRSVNDGAELDRTMRDLGELYPAVNSVSVVPAGLTKYREEKGLYPLAPFSPEECRQVIRQVEAFSEEFYKANGSHFVYCGDEFYVKGGVQLHTGEYYDGYPQLANGVGMMTSMYEDFSDALAAMDLSEYQPERPREVSIATGKAAYELICVMANALCARCPGLKCHVYAIRNDFFGDNITVSGLLTGQDIAAQLRRMPLGERLLLPANTLRFERDLFLDGMTPKELSEKLMVPVEFTENDGRSFIETVLK